MEQYREACEQWADAQLEPSPAASKEAAEKGGSKATFKAKSSGKSNPLRARLVLSPLVSIGCN
jgi:hypothetical protein